MSVQLSKEEIDKLFPDDNFGKDFEANSTVSLSNNNNVNSIPLLPPVPEHLDPNYRFTHLEPTEVYLARLETRLKKIQSPIYQKHKKERVQIEYPVETQMISSSQLPEEQETAPLIPHEEKQEEMEEVYSQKKTGCCLIL